MIKNRVYILKNGLKLVFCQDNTKHVTLASLFVKFGGGYKKFEVDGVKYDIDSGMAHFIEHLLIEHSKFGNCLLKFKEKHTFSNGYTNKNHTEFLINSVVDFEDDLIDLINIVNCPVFTVEDVYETKKAIIKEKMMAKDNKFDLFCKLEYECLFERVLYPNVLGEIDDINNINYEKVKICYDTFYQPFNQVLIISGNFNMKRIKKVVEDTYSNLNKKKINFSMTNFDEKNVVVQKNGFIEKDIYTDYVRVNYKINVSEFLPNELIKLEFYLHYFLSYLFDSKSVAYNSLVEDEVCLYNINYSIFYEDKFFVVQIGTATNNHDAFVNKVIDVIENKYVNEEDFLLRKKESLIDIILREDKLSDTIVPFIENIMKYGYDEMDKVSDIEEQNFEEYKNIINKLDFSNYMVAKMIRQNN